MTDRLRFGYNDNLMLTSSGTGIFGPEADPKGVD